MKRTLKQILKGIILQKRTIAQHIVHSVIFWNTKLTVIGGPFKGMNYVENSKGGAYLPKLLGIYEKELHEKILNLSKNDFDKIINVGAGEGYFTIGFLKILRSATAVAYEPTLYACYLMEKLAELNQVSDRLRIEAKLCFPINLQNELQDSKKTMVFMDVEGAELELLDPVIVPGLIHAYIIVEIHDTVSPTLGETIWNRFKNTHNVFQVLQEDRVISDYTFKSIWLKILPKAFTNAIHEGRGSKMRWFIFEPNNN